MPYVCVISSPAVSACCFSPFLLSSFPDELIPKCFLRLKNSLEPLQFHKRCHSVPPLYLRRLPLSRCYCICGRPVTEYDGLAWDDANCNSSHLLLLCFTGAEKLPERSTTMTLRHFCHYYTAKPTIPFHLILSQHSLAPSFLSISSLFVHLFCSLCPFNLPIVLSVSLWPLFWLSFLNPFKSLTRKAFSHYLGV